MYLLTTKGREITGAVFILFRPISHEGTQKMFVLPKQ
jgi:hypothetical protein